MLALKAISESMRAVRQHCSAMQCSQGHATCRSDTEVRGRQPARGEHRAAHVRGGGRSLCAPGSLHADHNTGLVALFPATSGTYPQPHSVDYCELGSHSRLSLYRFSEQCTVRTESCNHDYTPSCSAVTAPYHGPAESKVRTSAAYLRPCHQPVMTQIVTS
jgi:hypothetical protein